MSDLPQIVTFYSYKGGVGRSMAILNVAYALANQGHSVLVLDMDLEAPGLSGFLSRNKEIHSTAPYDIVDLIAWAKSASRMPEPLEQAALPPASDYIVSVPTEKIGSQAELSGLGRLDVIPVDEGRDYYGRMTGLEIGSLDRTELIRIGSLLRAWLKGRTFTENLPEYYGIPAPTHHYDFILIDSRTGVTEIGGLCIGPLSDSLVVLTALNDQNVNGTKQFLNEVGVLGNASGDRLDPKPTLIVASPVPAGEVNTKKARIEELIKAVGPIVVKLSYHPQQALFETIFVRDYQDEYLAKEYLQLVELVAEFGSKPESLILVPELLKLSKSEQREKIRPLLVRRSRSQVAQLAFLSELFAEAIQDNKNEQLDADFALLDRWLRITAKFDVQRANYSMQKRASLLMKWAELTRDSNLRRLRFEAAQNAFTELTESPRLTKGELANYLLLWGNELEFHAEQKSGEGADGLFKLACDKYESALRVRPEMSEAFYNWGNTLLAQARQKSGQEAERLFKLSGEKYKAALGIKPDMHEALNNWGMTFASQARQKSGEEADRLFMLAGEKYEASLRIKPDKHEALVNWGNSVLAQAQQKSGEEAERLFKLAIEKFESALRIEPHDDESLLNWAIRYSLKPSGNWAKRPTGCSSSQERNTKPRYRSNLTNMKPSTIGALP